MYWSKFFEYCHLNVNLLNNFRTLQYIHVHSSQETQICYHCAQCIMFNSYTLLIPVQVLKQLLTIV